MNESLEASLCQSHLLFKTLSDSAVGDIITYYAYSEFNITNVFCVDAVIALTTCPSVFVSCILNFTNFTNSMFWVFLPGKGCGFKSNNTGFQFRRLIH